MNLLELSPVAFKLLFVLFSYANTDGKCWPSQLTLMKIVGVGRKDILKRAIKELEDNNIVSCNVQLSIPEHINANNGKRVPKKQSIYYIDGCKSYLSIIDGTRTLNLQFGDRWLHLRTIDNATGRGIYRGNKIPSVNDGGNIEKTAKNSLVPLTLGERYEIALAHKVPVEEVARVEKQVLNPENIAKYKHKTTYYTTIKWIDMRIDDGKLQTLDANGMMLLKTMGGET